VPKSGRQPQVLAHPKSVKHIRHLILYTDAKPTDLVCLRSADLSALEKDLAGGGPHLASQHFEERALAGAVRPDQAAKLPTFQLEVDARHGPHASEATLQSASLEDEIGCAHIFRRKIK
jgi:hypothetical protein